MAVGAAPACSSALVKSRPSIGFRPTVRNVSALTSVTLTLSANPPASLTIFASPCVIPIPENDFACARISAKSGYEIQQPPLLIYTSLSFLSTSGNPLNSTASVTVNTAASIPMPSASIATAADVKPGFFVSTRSANRTPPGMFIGWNTSLQCCTGITSGPGGAELMVDGEETPLIDTVSG